MHRYIVMPLSQPVKRSGSEMLAADRHFDTFNLTTFNIQAARQ